jgi:adenosylcobyric acid synthase
VAGIYLHGMFDSPEALSQIVAWANTGVDEAKAYACRQEHELDRLADACPHMWTGRKHIHL